MGQIGHFILTPLYYAVSAVLLAWHQLFSLFLPKDGGASWALSVIGLTLVIRIALIPLFVKQIKSQRNMQLLQPQVKELQKKYGHDRQKLGEETMKLYKDSGTNPLASCLPLLIQMPIFFALFRLIDHAAKKQTGNGFLSNGQATVFAHAKIFGALPISSSFTKPFPPAALHVGDVNSTLVRVVAIVMVLIMVATTFSTQRQVMSKNMPPGAMEGQYAQQQKMLLYVLPVIFGVGGIAFPIGVLFYWVTSNTWTMGQQFYVIRNNPAPGTEAFKAKQERDRLKAEQHGGGSVATASETDTQTTEGGSSKPSTSPQAAQRQQPKRQTKAQRKAGGRPSGGKTQPKKQGGGA